MLIRNGIKAQLPKFLGPLNYQVLIDGYIRQAHIDHLLPFRDGAEQSDSTTPLQHVTSPEMEADDTIVLLTPP